MDIVYLVVQSIVLTSISNEVYKRGRPYVRKLLVKKIKKDLFIEDDWIQLNWIQ